MLRFGNISEFNPETGYARVKFADDDIVSDWLQVIVKNSIENKYYHYLDVNEQVACLMDENLEDGVVLGSVFSDNILPDGGSKDVVRVKFSDNSSVEYNRNTHEYNFDIKGKINIKSDSEVNIETQSAKIDAQSVDVDAETVVLTASTISMTAEASLTGNLTVVGTVTASAISTPILSGGGVTVSGGNIAAEGSVTADVNVTATGEVSGAVVKSGTVVLATHVHSGVTTGSGSTAPPTL